MRKVSPSPLPLAPVGVPEDTILKMTTFVMPQSVLIYYQCINSRVSDPHTPGLVFSLSFEWIAASRLITAQVLNPGFSAGGRKQKVKYAAFEASVEFFR